MLPLLQRGSINLPPCWEPLPPQVDCRPRYCSRVPQHGPAACVPLVIYLCTFAHPLLQTHTYTPTNYTLQTCTNNRLAFKTNTKLVSFRRMLMVVVLFIKSAGRWQQDSVSLGSRTSWCSHTVWCDRDRRRHNAHIHKCTLGHPVTQSVCVKLLMWFDEAIKTFTLHYIFFKLARMTVGHVLWKKNCDIKNVLIKLWLMKLLKKCSSVINHFWNIFMFSLHTGHNHMIFIWDELQMCLLYLYHNRGKKITEKCEKTHMAVGLLNDLAIWIAGCFCRYLWWLV